MIFNLTLTISSSAIHFPKMNCDNNNDNFVNAALACLAHNNMTADNLTLELFNRVQAGGKNKVESFVSADGTVFYYRIDGNYAQAIYLKTATGGGADKGWITIYSASDH